MSLIIVYVTHENEAEARRLSDLIVERRLAACANLMPIQSAYWWDGQLQHDQEWVSLLKSTADRWETLRDAIEQAHPYDVPCIVKIEVESNAAYEQWIRSQVE